VAAVKMKSMQLLTNLCELKWLNLQKCHQITEKCLQWILKQFAHLEHLGVAGNANITSQCFFIAPKTIRSVILTECQRLAATGISRLAQAFRDVLQHCVKLKELCSSLLKTERG